MVKNRNIGFWMEPKIIDSWASLNKEQKQDIKARLASMIADEKDLVVKDTQDKDKGPEQKVEPADKNKLVIKDKTATEQKTADVKPKAAEKQKEVPGTEQGQLELQDKDILQIGLIKGSEGLSQVIKTEETEHKVQEGHEEHKAQDAKVPENKDEQLGQKDEPRGLSTEPVHEADTAKTDLIKDIKEDAGRFVSTLKDWAEKVYTQTTASLTSATAHVGDAASSVSKPASGPGAINATLKAKGTAPSARDAKGQKGSGDHKEAIKSEPAPPNVKGAVKPEIQNPNGQKVIDAVPQKDTLRKEDALGSPNLDFREAKPP
jgi:hypothetical protein